MANITVPFHISNEDIKTKTIASKVLEKTNHMTKELFVIAIPSWPCYPESGSEIYTHFRLYSFIQVTTEKEVKRFLITEEEEE